VIQDRNYEMEVKTDLLLRSSILTSAKLCDATVAFDYILRHKSELRGSAQDYNIEHM